MECLVVGWGLRTREHHLLIWCSVDPLISTFHFMNLTCLPSLLLVASPVESNYAIRGGEGPPQEPQPIELFVASGQQEETINQGSWILISLPLVPYD